VCIVICNWFEFDGLVGLKFCKMCVQALHDSMSVFCILLRSVLL